MSFFTHLECPKCGNLFSAVEVINFCTCGTSLFARYNLDEARKQKDKIIDSKIHSLWRYKNLLPVKDEKNIVTLGEGLTPLLEMPKVGEELGINNLFIKDEGKNPSSSFKTRGASVSVSRLKELGVTDIVMSSSGNAGAAWAIYCKRGNINAHIFLPEDASESTQKECSAVGGDVQLYRGHISIGSKLVKEAMDVNESWFDVNTMKEPYRLEGKKTMGYEIAEQFNWDVPDVILYPTGGGVGLIGMWKAFNELKEMGLIEFIPKLVCVQYEGCAPLVKAFEEGKNTCQAWGEVDIIPGGMRSTKPFADELVLKALRETLGTAVSVSIQETYDAWMLITSNEGIFCSPEGATTIAAAKKLRESGFIQNTDRTVCFFTASGLKYLPLFGNKLSIKN
ncbi:MAG: hypothetical protein VR72_12565 [Clostridiaceae bacterium BRH_c20a]|nr:MAG: hypothetical protein VR72_12565 [Clostridiaceae bacterium BRH_c20a]